MSRNFNTNNKTKSTKERMNARLKWKTSAYGYQLGMGESMIKDNHWVERIHYGLIDHKNNSIIPRDEFMVETQDGRVLDFVADSYSLMRLNWTTAIQRGLVSSEGSEFGTLKMVGSYENPRKKYREYLGTILEKYNDTFIPKIIGITNISSYQDYVKNFFNYILIDRNQAPITMTRWNTSRASSILDTGLAFSYSDIDYDADQTKINKIIDHPSFEYFKNLCLNMGFGISKENPNILICELKSPANDSIRYSYGLFTLENIFNTRFIKTYTLDTLLLYNTINIYYNKFANKHRQTRVVSVECGKTVSRYILRETVNLDKRPHTDSQEIQLYCRIRNLEEGSPFPPTKMKNIVRKALSFLKKVDKLKAMSYINREFRDQVWNKNYGFHDLKQKLEDRTPTDNKTKVSTNSGGSSSY